ncbi:Uu.00g024080.m01.CDS01 [Anthostomella pinea]|uniref:Uu.00g024080.m01.CDS01 n=1 Tax=Anthostomella pinea TaxID=933095 RepID=A0AAI8W053_9PEZI|nr:Uu.00g024080.m01.CDS01 [Anthostomella pinea]
MARKMARDPMVVTKEAVLDTPDNAATPRPNRLLPERTRSELLYTPTSSDKASTSIGDGRDRDVFSDTSSMSKRSGRSSPTKREAAMRSANELRLQRISLDELAALLSVERATISLVEDLSAIRQKIGILPGELKTLFESQKKIADPLNDAMFASSSNTSEKDLEYQHRRLLRICKSTVDCNNPARPVHEAEWNDKVHSSILELALNESDSDASESLVFRNVTDARIAIPFRDRSALLRDNMVDYGIFLAPPAASSLEDQIFSFINSSRSFTQLNALESFEVDRPLAIAIETKRSRGGDANAPSQLANFARAHYRLCRYLFPASKQNIGSSGGSGTEPQSSGPVKPTGSALMLPLIEVHGPSWRINFAVLDVDRDLVSSDLAMGSTDQMSDCYVLLQSLRRLAKWADSECVAWWTGRLQGIGQG